MNKEEQENVQLVVAGVWSPAEVTYYGPHTRNIAFWGPVSYESSLPVISQLVTLNDISKKEPIYLHLNTEGGSLTDAYAIYDTIKSISAPVVTVATGMCASAGLTLLTAGDYKMATKNTIFFYHQAILDAPVFTSLEASSATAEAYEMCHSLYDTTLKENTRMSEKDWNLNFDKRTVKYFGCDEALKYGFVDKVIPYSKKKPHTKIRRKLYGK